jgi:hypothetical protein
MADTFIPKLVSATTAVVAGSSATFSLAGECPQVRFVWKATTAGNLCQIRWGKGSQVAVTTDMAMADTATECFGKQDATDGAVIGTGTLYIICGTGN